jgi:hypothetical protein
LLIPEGFQGVYHTLHTCRCWQEQPSTSAAAAAAAAPKQPSPNQHIVAADHAALQLHEYVMSPGMAALLSQQPTAALWQQHGEKLTQCMGF